MKSLIARLTTTVYNAPVRRFERIGPLGLIRSQQASEDQCPHFEVRVTSPRPLSRTSESHGH